MNFGYFGEFFSGYTGIPLPPPPIPADPESWEGVLNVECISVPFSTPTMQTKLKAAMETIIETRGKRSERDSNDISPEQFNL